MTIRRKINIKTTTLITIVLVMGFSFINSAVAEGISEKFYGEFINTFKGISYNSFCDADGRLSCLKGPAINFDNKCKARVKPFVDSCLNTYKSDLKKFASRIANKDYLENSELPVFLGNTITPCIEGGISIAQGNESSYVNHCFIQKQTNKKSIIAKKAKQQLLDNTRADEMCVGINSLQDLKVAFNNSHEHQSQAILFVTANWDVSARVDYNASVLSDAFSNIKENVECFKVDVTNETDAMLSYLDIFGVPVVVVVKNGVIFKNLSGHYKNRFSEFVETNF